MKRTTSKCVASMKRTKLMTRKFLIERTASTKMTKKPVSASTKRTQTKRMACVDKEDGIDKEGGTGIDEEDSVGNKMGRVGVNEEDDPKRDSSTNRTV